MPEIDQPQPLTEAQLHLLTETASNAARKSATGVLRRYVRAALIGYAVLFAGMGYAIHDNINASDLRAGLISSCERVNILRAQSNTSDAVSFRILSISAQREHTLSQSDVAATRRTHSRSFKLLAEQAGQLTLTGLTDCSEAVDHAKNYNFPTAHPVGDPLSGKLSQTTKEIITASRQVLQRVSPDTVTG
jgi:hypothetical protein